MKTTVFAFHPHLNDGSKLNRALAQGAQEAGFEVRDEYQLYPDFKVDVKAEQEALEAADRIVLQFPIYWYQVPTLLKQWFDDVLEFGWIHGVNGRTLQDKELLLVPSFGAIGDDYTSDGRFEITVDEILKPIKTIKFHTGLKVVEPFVTTGVRDLNRPDVETRVKAYVARLSEN